MDYGGDFSTVGPGIGQDDQRTFWYGISGLGENLERMAGSGSIECLPESRGHESL